MTGNTSTQNCSGELDTGSIVVLAFLNVISGLMAVVGNILVLTAVYRTPSLRTISNYFIASLSAADLMVGLYINPLLFAKTVKNTTTGTPLALAAEIASLESITATVYNLCAISADRFIAITQVFRYTELMTRRICVVLIISIWTFAIFFGCSRLMVISEEDLPKLWIAASIVHFVIPFSVISFCYFRIFREAKVQNNRIAAVNSLSHVEAARERKNRKAAWTVAIVIGVFTVFLCPNIVLATVQQMAQDDCEMSRLYRYWFWFSWLSFCSSAVNPWIYGIRSREFRHAFKRIFHLEVSSGNTNTSGGTRSLQNVPPAGSQAFAVSTKPGGILELAPVAVD